MSHIVTRSNCRQACLAALSALLVSTAASADDISVYTKQLGDQKPNILFVLDYSRSMKKDINGDDPSSTGLPAKIDILKDAVNNVIDEYADVVNVGLGSLYGNSPSGVRWPVSDLTADANTIDQDIPAGQFTVQDIIKKQLDRIPPGGATSTVNALVDAALYFGGKPVTHNDADAGNPWPHKPDTWNLTEQRYNQGNAEAALAVSYTPRDAYKNNVLASNQTAYCSDYSISGGHNSCAGKTTYSCQFEPDGKNNNFNLCKFDSKDKWDGASYDSPITQECQANSIILISDGLPTRLHDNASLQSVIGNSASACEDLSVSVFGASPGGEVEGNCGLEVIRQLAGNAQVGSISDSMVITHTVGFSVTGVGQTYLSKLAQASVLPDGSRTGKFHNASQPEELEAALKDLFTVVLGDGESFTELAIDVDKASFSHDNRAFFNLFTPSRSSSWAGNLKGYFIQPSGLIDTNGGPAIVTDTDGTRFDDNAQSFWSASADGNKVAEGGASELLLNGGRNLYTYTGATLPSGGASLASGSSHLLEVSNTDLTTAMLGLPSGSPERDLVLDWIQTAPMGDPLHSKSVSVDYGSRKVVFAMTNQGFLHAFDATHPIDPTANDHTGGEEIFAFMPQELLVNLPDIKSRKITGSHIYGLDGALTRWHDDDNNDGIVNGSDRLLLVFGMRRGGSSYYALDVTNPDNPSFAWHIDANSSGFERLGQTWSRTSLITVKRGGSKERVLVFGGGYDAATLDGTTTPTPAKGNAIYMVDSDGDKIWSMSSTDETDMQYSIASDLTAMDSDADGMADRLYVGDLGGQVWRVDFDDVNSSSSFKATLLADLATGGHQPFFYAPSVALNRAALGDFLSISLGSGNRTQPLLAGTDNAFFMIRDEDVDAGAPTSSTGTIATNELYDATANYIGASDAAVAEAAVKALQDKNGWMVKLGSSEKALSRLVTFEGKLLATTFEADTASSTNHCGFSSKGRFYMMDVETAQPLKYLSDGTPSDNTLNATDRMRDLSSTGIPSSPVIVFPKGSNAVQIIVDKETVNLINQELARVFWHSK